MHSGQSTKYLIQKRAANMRHKTMHLAVDYNNRYLYMESTSNNQYLQALNSRIDIIHTCSRWFILTRVE